MAEFKVPTAIIAPKRSIGTAVTATGDGKEETSTKTSTTETAKKVPEEKVTNTAPDSVDSVGEKPKPKAPIVSAPRAREAPTLPYEEPDWAGLPPSDESNKFWLEVIKGGALIETIPLVGKSVFTVGRLPHCDVKMEHPSMSRYHAVLQFKKDGDADKEKVGPAGFYLYDLKSGHGCYHNKKKCYPQKYYRIRVGHALKFGGSTRMILLQGPEEDMEEESAESMTELQKKAREKAEEKKRIEEETKVRMDEERQKKEQEEMDRGISWGFADDAEEEENDMALNPFALPDAENESLYLDDPKKTLRGWFEREGHELEYKCEEKGYANFRCTVELPLEEGRILAEAEVKGKKKEAVVQCALEACRILDRRGLLRQANHESKRKKVEKKWEEDDFYASDEDEFLDRTGSIQRKRKSRMKMAGAADAKPNVETFDSLVAKKAEIEAEIALAAQELAAATQSDKKKAAGEGEEEDLDSFMDSLKKGGNLDKATITKLKVKLANLKSEALKLSKLIDIARPAPLPTSLQKSQKGSDAGQGKSKLSGILVGKRKPGGGIGGLKSMSAFPKPSVTPASSEKLESSSTIPAQVVPSNTKPSCLASNVDDKPSDDASSTSDDPTPENTKTASERRAAALRGPMIPDHLRRVLQEEKEREEKDEEEDVAEGDDDAATKKTRKDRGRKRKAAAEDEEAEDLDTKDKKIIAAAGDYDTSDPDYAVWQPPAGQTGDGRTSLNDKLGY